MRYFIDTEFIEYRKSLDLISIGIVDENDREYYAISTEFKPQNANKWVRQNVFPNLPGAPKDSKIFYNRSILYETWVPEAIDMGSPAISTDVKNAALLWKNRANIAADILEFCDPQKYGTPEFWGEWCAYDWVVFCWLFGHMIDLPEGFPMRCNDFIQYAESHLGIKSRDLPPSLETEGNHNALLGAKTVKQRFQLCSEGYLNLQR